MKCEHTRALLSYLTAAIDGVRFLNACVDKANPGCCRDVSNSAHKQPPSTTARPELVFERRRILVDLTCRHRVLLECASENVVRIALCEEMLVTEESSTFAWGAACTLWSTQRQKAEMGPPKKTRTAKDMGARPKLRPLS
jgi:hypothetical protein